jgi:hypothetical protein
MKYIVQLLAAFAALLSFAAPIDASDCTYTHTYLGNLPKEGNPGWHSETQRWSRVRGTDDRQRRPGAPA